MSTSRRRRRKVVVPQAVVDRLEVPNALAGLHVEADEALSEQVVARPVSAIIIVRRRRQREVDVPELLVAARRRPHVGVPRVLPRRAVLVEAGQPCLVTRLALARDRVENPELLAGPHVVAAHVAGRHLLERRHCRAGDVGDGRANHDDVVDDKWRRPPAEALDGPVVVPLNQVDLAAVAERGVSFAGLGVQRDQPGPDHREDARVAPVGPVRHASSREPSFRFFVFGRRWRVEPDHRTCGGVERSNHAEARHDVEEPLCHEWRVLGSGRGGYRVALPRVIGDRRLPPDDLEIVDVVGVDFIERGVLGAGLIGCIRAPFAGLAGCRQRRRRW